MTSPVACLLMYSLLSAGKVGGVREAGQVCPCAGVVRRRALREQLALSRGPTEGAGEKLSPPAPPLQCVPDTAFRRRGLAGGALAEMRANMPSGQGLEGSKVSKVCREAGPQRC